MLASCAVNPSNFSYDRIYTLSTATGQSACVVHAPNSANETVLHELNPVESIEDQHLGHLLADKYEK